MNNKQRRLTIAFTLLVIDWVCSASLADTPLLSAVTPLSQTAIQLRFDQKLHAESAEQPSNYHLQPDIKIEYALLDTRMNIVLLHTSPLEIGKQYTLVIHGLRAQGASTDAIAPQKEMSFTLPETMEVTFGEGEGVTFSGVLRDTLLIVHPKKKQRNDNAGGEPFLLCTPIGGVFFAAFEIIDAFEEIGITQSDAILEASISLHAESVENDTPQEIIIRRVLLPWKEGVQKSQSAQDNELTYNSSLHRNLPWNKPPAQAMLEGINGAEESDYNGSEDVAHRIDGATRIQGASQRYVWKGELITDAYRFWLANPDYNYGYLFALRDGSSPVRFASKEHSAENHRPVLTIRYTTHVNVE